MLLRETTVNELGNDLTEDMSDILEFSLVIFAVISKSFQRFIYFSFKKVWELHFQLYLLFNNDNRWCAQVILTLVFAFAYNSQLKKSMK